MNILEIIRAAFQPQVDETKLAKRHLSEAKISLLESEAQREYWTGQSSAMRARITRLEAKLKEELQQDAPRT